MFINISLLNYFYTNIHINNVLLNIFLRIINYENSYEHKKNNEHSKNC
jgi:hypothetical protein